MKQTPTLRSGVATATKKPPLGGFFDKDRCAAMKLGLHLRTPQA